MSDQLSKNIISGISWTTVQTVGAKIISLATQLVLAWLLLPEDFGKVGIATSITSITFLIQGLGILDVLISRGPMYSMVYNLAKSLAFISAMICFVVTILVALILGVLIYNDVEITYLVLIFSFAIPFNAMSIVADARLRIDLKFKEISYIRLLEFFTTNILIVGLVILNFGIYSFVIGPLTSSVLRYFLLHRFAKVPHVFTYNLNHYKFLLGNSIYNFFQNLFQTIIRHSDYLIMGLFVTTESVGIYFMGYSLSVQVISLLVLSLSPVFFPVLKKIPRKEEERIKDILIKIVIVFSMFGMCFSLLQASLAEPLVEIFLDDKWLETIQIVQILSIGIGFNVASTVWTVSFRLRDDFKNLAKHSFFALLVFVSLVSIFTFYQKIIGTAIAVSLYNGLANLILLLLALKKFNISSVRLLIITCKYFIVAFAVFYFFYYWSNRLDVNSWVKIFTSGLVPTSIYFLLIYFFDSESKNTILLLKNKVFKR